MSGYIDLSMPISPAMPTNEPDHFPPRITPYADIASHGWAGSTITIDSHCGTHVDAPSHFVAGEIGVDEIPLDTLVGTAQRIDVQGPVVSAEQVAGTQAARIVVHTGCSEHSDQPSYITDYTHLDVGAAHQLVRNGVRLVGIDSPSVDAPGVDAVHQILLGHGVIIVENLANTAALPDVFELIVSPLRIVGGDGSPARVVAIAYSPGPGPTP
jgi:arylformamidase